MLKFLITAIIIYYIYRFFIRQPAVGGARENDAPEIRDQPSRRSGTEDEGEYIDYEEID